VAWIAWSLILFVKNSVPVGRYGYSIGSFDNAQITGATISYYDVRGSSQVEIHKQVVDNGPLLADGRHAAAVTKSELTWSETFDGTDACRVVAADVRYSVAVVLPRWTDPQDGSLSLNLHWKEYFNFIIHHEGTHVWLNLAGIANVRLALLRSDCHNADANARAAWEENVRLNEEFDKRTSERLEPLVIL
jgi:predicted secreted Zn-dependent protease